MFEYYIYAFFFAAIYCSSYQTASVYCENEQCTFKLNVLDVDSATAYGVYHDTLEETGWGILNITAGRGSKAANEDIMFAAGYLEAVLTNE